MRIFAKYRGKTYVIPCKETRASIGSLVHEVLRHCTDKNEVDESRYILSLTSCGAILSTKDMITDALQDGDFVTLSECRLYNYTIATVMVVVVVCNSSCCKN